MSDVERTLFLVKPDGVQRALVGEILSRMERRGVKIVGMKLMQVSSELANRHYEEHIGKPFFEGLVRFITSSPVVACVLQGPGAVGVVRQAMGVTDPKQASPGTVRGDLGLEVGRNLVHGSDSPESAAREVALFFTDEEIVDWDASVAPWVIES
jgi:nucleoside-diphosphate kinase